MGLESHPRAATGRTSCPSNRLHRPALEPLALCGDRHSQIIIADRKASPFWMGPYHGYRGLRCAGDSLRLACRLYSRPARRRRIDPGRPAAGLRGRGEIPACGDRHRSDRRCGQRVRKSDRSCAPRPCLLAGGVVVCRRRRRRRCDRLDPRQEHRWPEAAHHVRPVDDRGCGRHGAAEQLGGPQGDRAPRGQGACSCSSPARWSESSPAFSGSAAASWWSRASLPRPRCR